MCLVGGTPFYVFKYLPPNLPTLYVLGGCFRGFEQIPLQMRLKIRDIAPSQITKDRQIERPLVQRQIAEFLTGPPLALEILSLDKQFSPLYRYFDWVMLTLRASQFSCGKTSCV